MNDSNIKRALKSKMWALDGDINQKGNSGNANKATKEQLYKCVEGYDDM